MVVYMVCLVGYMEFAIDLGIYPWVWIKPSGGRYLMYIGYAGTLCTQGRGVSYVHQGEGYPVYIREGLPDGTIYVLFGRIYGICNRFRDLSWILIPLKRTHETSETLGRDTFPN